MPGFRGTTQGRQPPSGLSRPPPSAYSRAGSDHRSAFGPSSYNGAPLAGRSGLPELELSRGVDLVPVKELDRIPKRVVHGPVFWHSSAYVAY